MNIFKEPKHIESILKDEGFGEYIGHKNLLRLKGISYLSTINYIHNKSIKYDRYEHSLSVAYLSLLLSKRLKLNTTQTRTMVIMNLLHDIGHVSFSHASETYILEKYRKYHHGLLYYFYRDIKGDNNASIEDLVKKKEDQKTQDNINRLILNEKTDDSLLNQIHFSSLNVDRIEGNNRTLYSLGEKYIDPLFLIEAFHVIDNELFIDFNKIDYIYQFWDSMKNLYSKYIYTFDVLVCEAMLTRALEITFEESENYDFAFLSDQRVIHEIKKNEQSKKLIERVICSDYIQSCKENHPELILQFEDQFRESRWDRKKRKELEENVAKILKVIPSNVISHFSYKKYFYIDMSEIYQFSLFDKTTDYVHINKIDQAIYKKNKQGDVFDIFYSE